MRNLTRNVLLAYSIVFASCTHLSPLPTHSTQQPVATLVAEVTKTGTDPTATIPPGLTWANPATLLIPVEHPQMTITLVGMGLPAGFPFVTPDLGYRFVAPQLSFFCQLPATSSCQPIGPFELIDSQGTRHSPAISVSGEGFLPREEFPGGTAITGGMVFMVPIDAAPFMLRYIGHQGREAFFLIE